MRSLPLVTGLLALAACAPIDQPSRDYLSLWTASSDTTQPDFLAVIDVTEDSTRYGALVTTLAVPGLRNVPHHIEHELAPDRKLFANGYGSGHSFVFDLTTPTAPVLATQFDEVDGYSHPHSFVRLPNGNVLATFQMRHGDDGIRPGGLVELSPDGVLVRSSSADGPGVPAGLRPYSAAVVPLLDRIVTTTTDMDESNPYPADQLQVWRLSTLELLHTITLPAGPLGDEGRYTSEPRLMADGRTVLVSTFNCGLYLMDGLDGDTPSGRLVASFPRKTDTYCASPVIAGNHYLVTVPAWSGVVSLDISDSAAPREVSRVSLGPGDVPHWISLSPDQRRVVITGYGAMRDRAFIAQFDSATGQLTLDPRFRDAGDSLPGFAMTARAWPHGGTAAGIPHGAVFGRR